MDVRMHAPSDNILNILPAVHNCIVVGLFSHDLVCMLLHSVIFICAWCSLIAVPSPTSLRTTTNWHRCLASLKVEEVTCNSNFESKTIIIVYLFSCMLLLSECMYIHRYVINPDWAAMQGWHVVTQLPGQLLFSRLPHSVLGFSLWSVAWNACSPSSLSSYVEDELGISQFLRANPLALDLWTKAKQARGIVISPALMEMYVRTRPSDDHATTQHLLDAAKLLTTGDDNTERMLRQHDTKIVCMHITLKNII